MNSNDSETREFFLGFNEHTRSVRQSIAKVVSELIRRSAIHDDKKLRDEEVDRRIERRRAINHLKYGSPEREEADRPFQGLQHGHYCQYRHHPQHFENGIDDMNLVDVIEMVCDWAAYGNLDKSLKHNQKTYCVSPQLMKLIKNTIKDFDLDQ